MYQNSSPTAGVEMALEQFWNSHLHAFMKDRLLGQHYTISDSGNPDFRKSGCLQIRSSGIPEIQDSGSPGIRNSRTPKIRDSRIPKIRDSGNQEFRTSGFPEFRESGITEFRAKPANDPEMLHTKYTKNIPR